MEHRGQLRETSFDQPCIGPISTTVDIYVIMMSMSSHPHVKEKSGQKWELLIRKQQRPVTPTWNAPHYSPEVRSADTVERDMSHDRNKDLT